MSHGNIYQLATKPIADDKKITPDEFYDNHDAYADWIGDEEEGEEREVCIRYLASELQGMFDLDEEEGVLVYKGIGNYLQEWVDAIHEKAQAITVENVLNYLPRATLKDVLNGTHKDNTDRFVIEEYCGRCAEPMADLIEFVKDSMKPGDKLYFGAIIDFHY